MPVVESPAITTGFPAGMAIFDDQQHAMEDAETERQRHKAMIAALDPPISKSEQFRDAMLRFLDSPLVQWTGIVVFVLIVIDDLLFISMLMGWQNMCDEPSPTDCWPRNAWYNYSVQLLTLLFTYIAVVSFPWRMTQFLHTSGCSCRANGAGCNVHGIPNDPDIWTYLPASRRLGITSVLLVNCITQFLNQGTRIIYPTYTLQSTYPGTFWTNIFFMMSLVSGVLGLLWTLYEMGRVRNRYPGCFGPGPLDTVRMICQTSSSNTDSVRGLIRYASNPEVHNRRIQRRKNIHQRRQQERRATRITWSSKQPAALPPTKQPQDNVDDNDHAEQSPGNVKLAPTADEGDEWHPTVDIEATSEQAAVGSSSTGITNNPQTEQAPSQVHPLPFIGDDDDDSDDDDPDRLAEFVASVTRNHRRGVDGMRSSADPTRNSERVSVLGTRTSRAGPRLFGL